MTQKKVGTLVSLTAALMVAALSMGCSHNADNSSPSALAAQQKGVMGAPAPPDVRAKIDAQMAQQKAAQQAAQQAASQQAASKGQPK